MKLYYDYHNGQHLLGVEWVGSERAVIDRDGSYMTTPVTVTVAELCVVLEKASAEMTRAERKQLKRSIR